MQEAADRIQMHIAMLAKTYGNNWPEAALARLLELAANLAVEDYQVETNTVDQESLDVAGYHEAQAERWALSQWALAMIEAGIAFTQGPVEH